MYLAGSLDETTAVTLLGGAMNLPKRPSCEVMAVKPPSTESLPASASDDKADQRFTDEELSELASAMSISPPSKRCKNEVLL